MSLKILPFFGRNKEKDTVQLFLKHADIVEEMCPVLQETVEIALKKRDFKKVKELTKQLSVIEKKGDVTRRRTAAMLYSGAFLPVMRSRLYDFSGRLDNVADTIQDAGNLLHYLEKKKVPKDLIELMIKLSETSLDAAKFIKPAINAMFENQKNFPEFIEKIKVLESKSDYYEKQVFDKLYFEKNFDATSMHIMSWTARELARIADQAEKVADTLVLLKIMNVG